MFVTLRGTPTQDLADQAAQQLCSIAGKDIQVKSDQAARQEHWNPLPTAIPNLKAEAKTIKTTLPAASGTAFPNSLQVSTNWRTSIAWLPNGQG